MNALRTNRISTFTCDSSFSFLLNPSWTHKIPKDLPEMIYIIKDLPLLQHNLPSNKRFKLIAPHKPCYFS